MITDEVTFKSNHSFNTLYVHIILKILVNNNYIHHYNKQTDSTCIK